MARMKEKDTEEELEKILYKDLSYKIVQSCFEVHNVLGPGYPEKIYEEAVAVELANIWCRN